MSDVFRFVSSLCGPLIESGPLLTRAQFTVTANVAVGAGLTEGLPEPVTVKV